MIKCNLKDYMELRNINFSQLSKQTKISRQALSSLANNESSGIQFSTLDTLLTFFNVPINEFFTQSAREYIVYIDVIDETDYLTLCIEYNHDNIEIPFSIDFYTNKHGILEIIEFKNISTVEQFKQNFYIYEPFVMFMLNDISEDRFNEFGIFLIQDLLQPLMNEYEFSNSIRVFFDLNYSMRIADVSLDQDKSPIKEMRSEFVPDDDRIFFIDFDD